MIKRLDRWAPLPDRGATASAAMITLRLSAGMTSPYLVPSVSAACVCWEAAHLGVLVVQHRVG